MQAIALSLQDSAGFLDVKSNCLPQSSGANLRDNSPSTVSGTICIDSSSDKRNKILYVQEDSQKRKRKKPVGVNYFCPNQYDNCIIFLHIMVADYKTCANV